MEYYSTSTYVRPENHDLIKDLDKKYIKVDRILNGIFIKKFYNQKSLERLRRRYGSLWWKEIRKNGIIELKINN